MGKRQPCQGPVQPKVSAHNQRGQRWKITEAMQKPRWRSPDVILRQHIEKQLVEPSVSITRHTEEIPFTDSVTGANQSAPFSEEAAPSPVGVGYRPLRKDGASSSSSRYQDN
ncbi:uncharacterized protein LOC131446066 isoform X2 [Solea solea]|uniref:uncharacterized protein LOC131446066 isoform X2 n=1 Tax=Solea solea TaxID=90069 RepID=UPI00272D2011|nr:uncharacterized protein LOC131446066 isoform X2 [Solea solea]